MSIHDFICVRVYFRPAWQKASCWIWLASWSCYRGTAQVHRYETRIPLLITRSWWVDTLLNGYISILYFCPGFPVTYLIFSIPSYHFVLLWCWPSVWRTCGPPVAPTGRSATCWTPCGCHAARQAWKSGCRCSPGTTASPTPSSPDASCCRSTSTSIPWLYCLSSWTKVAEEDYRLWLLTTWKLTRSTKTSKLALNIYLMYFVLRFTLWKLLWNKQFTYL